jgi:hypothetical protein
MACDQVAEVGHGELGRQLNLLTALTAAPCAIFW